MVTGIMRIKDAQRKSMQTMYKWRNLYLEVVLIAKLMSGKIGGI